MVVQVGDQGVIVVDTGTKAMAPKLLAQIQRLAQEHAGEHKEIRKVINTNGRLDHIGGNEIDRQSRQPDHLRRRAGATSRLRRTPARR